MSEVGVACSCGAILCAEDVDGWVSFSPPSFVFAFAGIEMR